MLDSLKCFVMKKNGILEKVYVSGHTNKGMSKVSIKAIE